jgi:SecD/SecF fusion protein
MPFMHSMISLFAQVAPPAAPAVPWYQEPWFGVLIALAVVVLPFLAGHWIAQKLRMLDYGWRIGLILFALTAGIVICITGWPPKRGIDLSGGVILVYEVDQSKAGSVDVAGTIDQLKKDLSTLNIAAEIAPTDAPGKLEITLPGTDPAQTNEVEAAIGKVSIPDTLLVVEARPIREGHQILVVGVRSTRSIDMDRMISAISKRVNPGGQLEVTIRRMGNDRVEVIIPQAEPAEVDIVKQKISTAGALAFRILANTKAVNDEAIIELAKRTESREVKQKDYEGKEEIVAEWVPIDPEQFPDLRQLSDAALRQNKKGETEVLVLHTANDVYGGDLIRATSGHDENGMPDVIFAFNSHGASRFGDLTSRHLKDPSGGPAYQLGIVLDGVLKSAATIQSTITTEGRITGHFTDQQVQFIVDILNAGSLPAALAKVPVSEYSASAQLGNDTIRAGAFSMIVATVAILIFMQIYYGFSGFIANLAVLMNLVLVLALMILIRAHLTLAGLAGLVLSVGMAVDANVLIYERMREEQERGAALRMAIRNGFGRAMATIIDSHCTTLITGIVLFVIGTDQLRGFATTLVLGLLLNLFTAVYCSRIVFDIAERQRILKHLNMMRIFGKTNFDFVKWMPRWMAISVTAIVVGMGGAVAREMGWFGGAGLFGIDFTGGTAVQVVFNEPTDISAVRRAIDEAKLPDASVSAVASTGGQLPNTRFNIDTSMQGQGSAEGTGESRTGPEGEQAIKVVQDRLRDIFKGQLKMYSMEVVSVEPAKPDSAEVSSGKKSDGEKAADAEKSETPATSTASGTVATLRFPDSIKYTKLESMLKDAQKANSLPETAFDISSPDKDFLPGSGIAVQDWTVRSSLNKEQTQTLLGSVKEQLGNTPVFPTASNIGGKVAGDTETTAYYALFVSNVLVALYIWIRFQNLIFGLAAIVALIHDVFIAVGALALSYWLAGPLGFLQVDPFKISLEVVAALLTIVGYSINDTIVVFDRIREIRGKSPELTATMINQAVNQTLSRTILTSTTVFLVTFILYFAGGEGVHAFSFAMMIGVLTGTYSSVFIAAPILLWFRRPAGAPSGDRKASLEALRPTRAA